MFTLAATQVVTVALTGPLQTLSVNLSRSLLNTLNNDLCRNYRGKRTELTIRYGLDMIMH